MRRGTTKRYKVALLGLGAMGQRHARVLGELDARFELVGAYDLRGEAPTPAGVRRLRSEVEAIAAAEVVLVATPIEAHAPTVMRALAAGRHVFVEKPVCATGSEARAALAATRHGGARLFVGHSERFNPVVRALARLVRDDDVDSVSLRRVGPSKPSGAGVLINLGVHDFDLAAYLAGGEVTLRSAVGRWLPRPSLGPGEDAAHVLFTTASGAMGHLHVDRTVPTKQRVIELLTTRWAYRGDLFAHRLVRTARAPGSGHDGAPCDVPLALEEPLLAQANALAEALDGGSARDIASGVDGMRALALCEDASALCAEGAADGADQADGAGPGVAENLSLDAHR